MAVRLRATYSQGVFIPLPGQMLPDFPEAAEVEIIVEAANSTPHISTDEAQRAALLREIAESMKANSLKAISRIAAAKLRVSRWQNVSATRTTRSSW